MDQWSHAINTQAGDAGNATHNAIINLTVTNNSAANPVVASAQHGFVANIGASGVATAADVACTDIANNTLDGNAATGGGGVRLRQRGMSTIKIPGYLGAQYDSAAVIAFETGKNPASTPAPTACHQQRWARLREHSGRRAVRPANHPNHTAAG